MMIFGRVSTAMVTPFDSKGMLIFKKRLIGQLLIDEWNGFTCAIGYNWGVSNFIFGGKNRVIASCFKGCRKTGARHHGYWEQQYVCFN